MHRPTIAHFVLGGPYYCPKQILGGHVTPPFYRESGKPYQFYGESS